MNQSCSIAHEGVVRDVKDGIAYISYTQQGGCSSCSSRTSCAMNESAEHELRIPVTNQSVYAGAKVTIHIASDDGMRAVLLSYFVPLLIIVTCLMVLIYLGYPEGISALLSIAALVPYFLLLKLFDKKLGNTISLQIHS